MNQILPKLLLLHNVGKCVFIVCKYSHILLDQHNGRSRCWSPLWTVIIVSNNRMHQAMQICVSCMDCRLFKYISTPDVSFGLPFWLLSKVQGETGQDLQTWLHSFYGKTAMVVDTRPCNQWAKICFTGVAPATTWCVSNHKSKWVQQLMPIYLMSNPTDGCFQRSM